MLNAIAKETIFMNFNKQIFTFLIFELASSGSIFAMKPGGASKNMARKAKTAKTHKTKKILSAKQQKKLNNQLRASVKELRINIDRVRHLLATGAQVNAKDVKGYTALMEAAQNGDESICKLLLNHGAQVNTQNDYGDTALMLAAGNDHALICKLLINYGAEVDAKDLTDWTALMTAANKGCESACELLIDHGAQLDTQDCLEGSTALMLAIDNCHTSISRLLLYRNAQLDIKDFAVDTALMRATAKGQVAAIRTLITYPHFSPFLSEEQFQESRQRIWTALCVFKRYCPSMPKDIRKFLLCMLPELLNDVVNSGAFESFKNLSAEQTQFVPLPTLRLLIKTKQLDPYKIIAAIKAHHLQRIIPYIDETIFYARIPKPEIRALLKPADLERNFGAEIEQIIKIRLGLLSETEKTAHLLIDSCSDLIPESCSVQ
jgi:ankyrin repeat protein